MRWGPLVAGQSACCSACTGPMPRAARRASDRRVAPVRPVRPTRRPDPPSFDVPPDPAPPQPTPPPREAEPRPLEPPEPPPAPLEEPGATACPAASRSCSS